MKLAEISVPLPLYRIESDVTYHTERKPTVFERMVLRLCDPGLHLPDKKMLSLLSIFQDQLGVGDVRELLEACVSELSALGALPKHYALDAIEAPLTELELTADGLQFLRSDSLPVRSRTVKVWHRYDPISDEIKPTQNDGTRLSQSDFSRVSVADQALRPQNPLPQVERAIAQETYDWKTPATVIDRIAPMAQLEGRGERRLEISCSEDGALSASAPRDAALQQWLAQAQPELAWEILLDDALTSEPSAYLPVIDTSVLREARSARLITATSGNTSKARLCVVAQGVVADATTPTIVLSSEVNAPELVANGKQPTVYTLLVPTPAGITTGFRSLSLPQIDGASVQVEVAGNLRLYWAGQPRLCGLAVTLNDQAATELWAKLRRDLEGACEHSDDPRIAFMPVAWRDIDAIGETVWPWLATRAEQPLGDLIALIEPATQAIGLWRPSGKDWKPAWEVSLARAIDESLRHTPNQLEPEEVASLLTQVAQMLPADKAVPLQAALLHHAAPIRAVESLAKLRSALPSTTEIPEELLSIELRQVWLEHALERKELKLYGPHAIQQPMQDIQKAVQDVYRSIGEQALKAAGNSQMDVRTLTPRALDAVRTWRKAAESFHGLKISLPLWDALNEAVESWSLLAQEKLAPVEIGHRIAVLDTSALMEHPGLLQGLNSSDILVVPLRVLSELDGLKSSEDEARAVKARAAIRQLDASSSRIRHETDYAALLPAEWDARQPDHAILSTALFFRLNDVLFVSNDINLRTKAQSLGLNTQDSKSYAPSHLVPAAAGAPSIHSRKQDKRKNQRK
ncbi:PIN domain-containing protein [Pseudomonas aeruginosa]|uniref:PIN domain-containing protein n=1 Tax=Pseudomonas aeruginosa TaxID=287 RepID=UPI001FF6FB80|nr:PIN domain-containing protein [Pseudomonas aeruginosa]MCK0979049.1 PIN domain-containing protein [Pseudomonas aeruginosa]MCL8238279.1 PIN domain-containing protein [Pseudomonas aeruginosa]HBP6331110.1 nucleotide-binding protein [Pseudomonas aeruginosa]